MDSNIEFKRTRHKTWKILKDNIFISEIYKVQEYYMTEPEYITMIKLNDKFEYVKAWDLETIKKRIIKKLK